MAEAETPELALHVLDVLLGSDSRVLPGLYGVLLGRQAVGVVAKRVQHIAPEHPVIAGVDVRGDVSERVADVQARARGVREHVLHEQLVGREGAVLRRQRPDGVGRVKRATSFPLGLPPRLDLAREAGTVAISRAGLAGGGLDVVAGGAHCA